MSHWPVYGREDREPGHFEVVLDRWRARRRERARQKFLLTVTRCEICIDAAPVPGTTKCARCAPCDREIQLRYFGQEVG